MMIKVAIAIGLGIFVFVAICCVSWGIWRLRHRISKGQISATPDEIPVEYRKDVVQELPTIKTSDLKVDGGAKLRCPICWLDFRDEDIMRQLPQCDHIFHRHCIDRRLDMQITCPVCSSVLVDGVSTRKGRNVGQETGRTPSWVLINRPVPLPRTAVVNSSSSSERFEIELNPSDSVGSREGESPLLKHLAGSHAEDWNDVDLEKCIDISFTFGTEIPVEKRQQISSSHSFSFGVSGADTFTFPGTTALATPSSDELGIKSLGRRSTHGRDSSTSSSDFNPSTRYSRTSSRSSRTTNSSSSDSSFQQQMSSWDFTHAHLQEVSEHDVSDHHPQPLTSPPELCSFDVVPVIDGSMNHHDHHPFTPQDYNEPRQDFSTYPRH